METLCWKAGNKKMERYGQEAASNRKHPGEQTAQILQTEQVTGSDADTSYDARHQEAKTCEISETVHPAATLPGLPQGLVMTESIVAQ